MPSKPRPTAFSWEEIEIIFLSDFKVQIKIDGKPTEASNHAELGFESKQNGNLDKPG
ncbi:MAG: hypothetical protein ABI833_13540 [Acidobacteriota bacterium]